MAEEKQLSLEAFSPRPEVLTWNMLQLVFEASLHVLSPPLPPLASPHYHVCMKRSELLRSPFYQSEDKAKRAEPS